MEAERDREQHVTWMEEPPDGGKHTTLWCGSKENHLATNKMSERHSSSDWNKEQQQRTFGTGETVNSSFFAVLVLIFP